MSATGPEEIIATWLRTTDPATGQPVTLLNEALDSSETGVDVDNGSLFVIGDVIQVEAEQMQVTDISTNTLTVTRGYNSTIAATHADNTEVGVYKRAYFKLMAPIAPQAVDRFPGKVTIGDYSKDSNDILSAWIISDLSGGHGVEDIQEGVDDNRYRFGTLYTRYPGQWSKPFELETETLGSGAIFPLGDMYYSGTTYRMCASGAVLYQNTTSRGTMSGAPSDAGVMFRGTATNAAFYVPQGSNGYSTYIPATNTFTNNNGGGDPDFQSFVRWDEKLLGIANDGTIYYATAAAATTTWTAYTLGGVNLRLDPSADIKKLHVFYNRTDEAVPYVVTGGNVWALDADTPRFYQIPDFESVHPYFGVASAVWRGELFVASGMDIFAFNGTTIRLTASLSRDQGLPYLYSNYVRTLWAGQNALYALARGVTTGGVTYHSVHEWSGFGWHCVWATSNATVNGRLGITAASDEYVVYWGLANSGTIYKQNIPTAFTNPREAIAQSGGDLIMGNFTNVVTVGFFDYYQATYYLDTGKFDANMKGYRKIAQGVELDLLYARNGSEEAKRIYYRIDNDTTWTQLGADFYSDGMHQFTFGPTDPDGHTIGIDFEEIEFRVEVQDNLQIPAVIGETAVFSSLTFSFLKIMNPSLAWTTQLDLREDYHDAAPETMLGFLTELRTLPRFFNIKHRSTTYRVRMSGMQGNEEGGNDTRSTYQCSWLEIPSQLGVVTD